MNTNIFCGIKIHGTFSQMKTRSVPAQEKPYPPLTEVVKSQPVFTMENVSGTIVSFRCPAYVKSLNVPGYHLHFLSDDLTRGGHILDLTIGKAAGSIDTCNKLFLIVPDEDNVLTQRLLDIDHSKELEQVEK